MLGNARWSGNSELTAKSVCFCRSTLVCDTEREAKDLAFGSRGERHKVVTKAGLVISRDGAMTGGGELAAQAARYYEGQYQQLEQVLSLPPPLTGPSCSPLPPSKSSPNGEARLLYKASFFNPSEMHTSKWHQEADCQGKS